VPVAAEGAAPLLAAAEHTVVAAPVAGNVAAGIALMAAKPGMGQTGMLGLSAGAGVALSLYNTYHSAANGGTIGASLVSPTTLALTGGSALLLFAEKGGLSSDGLAVTVRMGGMALIVGGLVGAITGTLGTFGDSARRKQIHSDPNSQEGIAFANVLPRSPADLEGIELAQGNVIAAGRKPRYPSIYADPATAVAAKPGSTLAAAVTQARALAQADTLDRSEAIVQTNDGKYWLMQLAGELDQVDGRHFADGNDFDKRYPPVIDKKQQSLQAIVGVEHVYTYPTTATGGTK